MFQPLYAGGAGTANRYGGTRLGLALSRESARLIDGDVTVKGAPCVGPTFTLMPPAHAATAAQRVDT